MISGCLLRALRQIQQIQQSQLRLNLVESAQFVESLQLIHHIQKKLTNSKKIRKALHP